MYLVPSKLPSLVENFSERGFVTRLNSLKNPLRNIPDDRKSPNRKLGDD